ncbi:hypothetical protein ACFQ1I_16765 [Kitasatospora arboriphila]
MSLGTFRRAAAASVVLGVVGSLVAGPAYAATPTPAPSGSDSAPRWSPIGIAAASECKFPSENVQGTPWALQRVLLNELWKNGRTGRFAKDGPGGKKGEPVKVAVIDTGVNDRNPQLADKVEDGTSLLPPSSRARRTTARTTPSATAPRWPASSPPSRSPGRASSASHRAPRSSRSSRTTTRAAAPCRA